MKIHWFSTSLAKEQKKIPKNEYIFHEMIGLVEKIEGIIHLIRILGNESILWSGKQKRMIKLEKLTPTGSGILPLTLAKKSR